MLRKSVSVFMCIVCTLVCLPVFSSAAENVYYSSLPKPVPSNNVKYYIVDPKSSDPYLFIFSVPSIVQDDFVFQLNVDENGSVLMGLFSSFGLGFTLKVLVYDLNGNFISNRNVQISTDTIEFVTLSHYNVRDIESFETFDIPVGDPNNILSAPRTQVAWSDATDPSTYTTWLNQIYSKLLELDTNTDNLESQLTSISSQLTLFYNLFNSYQMQQHTDLLNLYNKLIDIYNILCEEQETYAPVEQGSQIDQFIQAESALNKDFSGALQNQFNTAGNIFTGNSAFAFISNTFQELILSNMSLNSLVIFALAIGLCVLVLGRRLNA